MGRHLRFAIAIGLVVCALTACTSAPDPTPASSAPVLPPASSSSVPSPGGGTVTVGGGASSVCADVDAPSILVLVALSSDDPVTFDGLAPGVVRDVSVGAVWVVERGPGDRLSENGLTIDDVPTGSPPDSLAAWGSRVPVDGATIDGGEDYALAVEISHEPGSAGSMTGFSLTYQADGGGAPRTVTSAVAAGFGVAGRLPAPARECQLPEE